MATYDLRTTIPSASQIAAGDILNAPYNGSTFSLTLPNGIYTLEVWGCASVPPQAELDAGYSYQQGGYAKGTLTLYANTAAYLLPGCGHSGGTRINGGNRWGGDASDIRLLSNSLYNRIIVAGGAGATEFTGSLLGQGGVGGGTTGGDGTGYYDPYPTVGAGGGGGTQTAGGAGNSPSTAYGKNGTFGAGGAYGGGGGWYGGGGGGQFYDAGTGVTLYGGGGGGSGFVLTSSSVSNVPSSYASALKNSTYYLTSTQLVNGNSSSRPATPYPHASDGDGYVRITVTSITPPLPPPSNLTYSDLTETSVKLSWTASPTSGATYAVYRGTTSLGTTTSTTFTDNGISAGTTYTYKVYATKTGYSDSSQITVSVTNPPKLVTPTAKTTTYTESATTISWNAVTNATAYKVWRGSTLLKSNVTTTSYTDSSGGGAGTSNTYYVSATASGYYESNKSSAITTSNKPKLANPALSASYTVSSTKVSWSAVKGTNGETVSGVKYNVWRGTTKVATEQSGTSYTDSTAIAGTSYTYKVQAVSANAWSSGFPTINTSNKPQVPTPTAKASSYTTTSTTIAWNAVSVESGVTVKYNVTGGPSAVTTTATSYTDTSAGMGVSGSYTVIATATGCYNSSPLTIATNNTSKPKLATPVLSASYTISSTTISWSAVKGTNGETVSGVKYNVWRGSTKVSTEQSGVSYTDGTAGEGTSYTYKVQAVSANATSSATASIDTSNNGQLPTPTAKTTTYTETSTKISWNAVTGATAYTVYRGTTLLTSTLTTTSYTDTSSYAVAGKSNTYKVSATGSGYYESAQLSISTSNPSKLATPTGLAFAYTVSDTTLTWNAVTNATSYKVWRGSTLLESGNTSRSYTDTSGGAGKSYTYYVAAVASGYYDSAQASKTSSNKQRFAKPTGLTASYTKTSTTISWSAVTSPANATVYNVWRGSTSLGSVTSSASTISYTDSSSYGASGKSYTYYVTAAETGSYYESAKASIKTSNPATLATPTGITAGYTETSTTISWNGVTNATSYKVYRGTSSSFTPSSSNLVSTQIGTSYVDTGADAGTGFTYKVIASNSPTYYDSAAGSVTSNNPARVSPVTNLRSTGQTVSSVTLAWSRPSGATSYTVTRNDGVTATVTSSSSSVTYTDSNTKPGKTYTYSVVAKASGKWDSTAVTVSVAVNTRLATPEIAQSSQTQTSVTLAISLTNLAGSNGVLHLYRDGAQITTHSGTPYTFEYTDSNLESKKTYTYSAYVESTSASYFNSLSTSIDVYVGKDYTLVERQRNYLDALKRPFLKLCRLRFLYPNGATAFALDNNPKNRRSKAFIQEGTVNANMQNGQRLTATVTIANANQEFDFNINKVWFGQDVALDEGLILPNGAEYWRQTGVFVIDNPQETVNPNTRTVSYNLVDKWADLDGTLDGNLEGTYEVPVNTNIYTPIAALLAEDRGNGRPVDNMKPVFTEYFNNKTQGLPDGTTASMVLSPYTLTVDGDGGTIGEVVLGLGGMVNAWVGYDNTGRLRVEPSQDDILDAQKAVLYRFNMDEVTLLGLAYTIKKEDLYNDYIVVGEQIDEYAQPGGRAENLDPRSDTNINIIGRKTKRENASGYATVTQCKDLAEWRLKRSGVLQKAVNISCSQMFHIELNSLIEIVRSDKPGNPTERHLIQGYSRPLATSGSMTITVVSVNDYPIATVSEWPPAT